MKSTVILLIVFAAAFVCIGWLVGGIITPIFTGIGAVLSITALIVAIRKKAK